MRGRIAGSAGPGLLLGAGTLLGLSPALPGLPHAGTVAPTALAMLALSAVLALALARWTLVPAPIAAAVPARTGTTPPGRIRPGARQSDPDAPGQVRARAPAGRPTTRRPADR